MAGRPKKVKAPPEAKSYSHPEAEAVLRPEIGIQAQFKKKKAPHKYLYDQTLDPALHWDGGAKARDEAEALLREMQGAKTVDEARAIARKLEAMSKPFLNWAGKAERTSFEVPTLPLFVHERLSTKAILETLKGHKRDKTRSLDFFGDTGLAISDRTLKAYEHPDKWANRLILGDSLVVMNSLLHFEGLGGQVQMIYMDPPYGVKFGSNFQPFVRKREVKHNEDKDLTREPETVQAYRDTWELGIHSYLTYMRDRLVLSRDMLHSSGSIFVQISDENLHHVRELLDEVFGAENFQRLIVAQKTSTASGDYLPIVSDFILWYSKDREQIKARMLYADKTPGGVGGTGITHVLLPDGTERRLTGDELNGRQPLPLGAKMFGLGDITSSKPPGDFAVEIEGKEYRPGKRFWSTGEEGMQALIRAGRVRTTKNGLAYLRFLEDFPVYPLTNVWTDTVGQNQFGGSKAYVVQTALPIVERCMLMVTDPGDLVLDPTCGSGTTAFVAEQWGRRWITIDTSRVPLALTRQRLLTATFPWHELREERRGPISGFVYKRRQNSRGEEVGGIIPHTTLKSIANGVKPEEEILADRPESLPNVTRVCGTFYVEATIPTTMDMATVPGAKGDVAAPLGQEDQDYVDRMLELLRLSPVLRLPENKTVTFKTVRRPARSLSLSAEGIVANGEEEKSVAFLFGPENGAVAERILFNAAKEANAKNHRHLYVLGFAIQPDARKLIEEMDQMMGLPATYVQVTPDVMMGDLRGDKALKTMRSSQIFSVCGLPDVALLKLGKKDKDGDDLFQVELRGLDVFDPVTYELDHRKGDDVPAWFVDTDYNELCFHVSQAFFPRTNAWESLKRALKGTHEESVWDHLSGTKSTAFPLGDHEQVAVKVIDDRGNELVVVKKKSEAVKA